MNYDINQSELLIFHVVADPRNSGKSAKSHKIHKNAQNTAKFSRNLSLRGRRKKGKGRGEGEREKGRERLL